MLTRLDGAGGWGDGYTQQTLELHNSYVNWLFADGHVSRYQVRDPEVFGDGNESNPQGIFTVIAGD